MANQAAKKRKTQNEQEIAKLKKGLIAVNVFYILYRLVWYNSTFSGWHWFGLIVTSLTYGLLYKLICGLAEPSYSPDGELLDGGADLGMSGPCEYYFDAIYVAGIVQLTTAVISEWFWLLFLAIPLFGVYKLWTSLLQPLLAARKQQQEAVDTRNKKKQEKAEKSASKVKYVRSR